MQPLGFAEIGANRKGAALVNKNDLIQKLSEHTGLPKNDAAKAVDGVFDLISQSLKSGDEVRLTGFGVFVVATRAGGKGRIRRRARKSP